MHLETISNEELIRLIRTSKTPENLLASFGGYLRSAIKTAVFKDLDGKGQTAFHLCVKENILLIPVLLLYVDSISSKSFRGPYKLLINQPLLTKDPNPKIVYHFFLAAISFIKQGANIEETNNQSHTIFRLLACANLDAENKFYLLVDLHRLVPSRLRRMNLDTYLENCTLAEDFIDYADFNPNKEIYPKQLYAYFTILMVIQLNEKVDCIITSVHAVRFLPYISACLEKMAPCFLPSLDFPVQSPKCSIDMFLFALQSGKGRLFGWNHRTQHFYANFFRYYPQAIPLVLRQFEGKAPLPADLFNNDELMGANCRLSKIVPLLNLIESKQLAFLIVMFLNARKATITTNAFISLPLDVFVFIFRFFNTDKPNGSIVPFMHFVSENYLVIREKVRKKEQVMILEDSSQEKPKFRLYESMRFFPPVYTHGNPKHQVAAPKANRCQQR